MKNAHAGLLAQIQPPAVPLENIHHPQTLFIVPEALCVNAVQGPLTGMAEGRVAKIVAQGDGLGQILVEVQRAGDCAGRRLTSSVWVSRVR